MIAVVKRLLLAVLTDKKALKRIGGIMLGIAVLIMMPIGALTALLSGGIALDPDELKQEVAALMSGEDIAGRELLSEKLSEISEAMEAAGFAEYVKPAQNISIVFLSDRLEDDGFAETLAGCFQSGQTTESFLTVVNATFGVEIAKEELTAVAGDLAIEPETGEADTSKDETRTETGTEEMTEESEETKNEMVQEMPDDA
jgi:hypothetical protein